MPAPVGLTVGQRVACPRCGEAFVVRDVPAGAPSPAVESAPPPPAPVEPPAKPVRANRRVAVAVLAGMAVMAVVGLAYALVTVDLRRANDRGLARKVRRFADYFRRDPPADDLPPPRPALALGYLPPHTGLVAVVQVDKLLASPVGREYRTRPVKLGNVDLSLDSVREWTGIDADNLDHLLLGVEVRDDGEAQLTPAVHLVVRTRAAYDAARVRAGLNAGKPRDEPTPDGGKRTVYTCNFRNLPLTLWLADDRTLVIGLFSTLGQLPAKPAEAPAPFSDDLRGLVDQQRQADPPVWLAGHARDWKKTWLPTLLANVKDVPLLTRLERLTGFALWLDLDRPARLHGTFRCADEAEARRIAADELEVRHKANPDRLEYSRDGATLTVRLTLDGGR
ncbi:MAG: hypothetical protein U0736_10715 [Gemmataceae bacterium]